MEYIIQRAFKMRCLVRIRGSRKIAIRKIFDMFMAGYTLDEIGNEVNLSADGVGLITKEY